jgi:hypothetical protein
MSWAALLEAAEAVRVVAVEREPAITGLRLAAIGWATVEHERAERELDELLGRGAPVGAGGASGSAWAALPRHPVLGARAWLRQGSGGGGEPALVVLEPDSEGRLAASLARFGEGVAAIYLGEGPLGPGRLVPGGASWGPHAILLGWSAEGAR